MPPKKPPKRLTYLALEKVGEYLINFCDGVSIKSYEMINNTTEETVNSSSTSPGAATDHQEDEWNAPDMRHHRTMVQDRERLAFNYVDEKIYWLQDQIFSSIPWYCHQSLVEQVLKVLSKATQNAKTIFRKTAGSLLLSIQFLNCQLLNGKMLIYSIEVVIESFRFHG